MFNSFAWSIVQVVFYGVLLPYCSTNTLYGRGWMKMWTQYNTKTTLCKTETTFGVNGVIKSPGYPISYPNNIKCKWIIEAPKEYTGIRLEFIKFNVENPKWSKICFEDFIEIFQFPNQQRKRKLRICGKKSGKVIVVNGNKMEIQFKSNKAKSRAGFQIKWKAIHACGSSQINKGSLTLPTSIITEKNFFCMWRLQRTLSNSYIDIRINNYTSVFDDCVKTKLTIFDSQQNVLRTVCMSNHTKVLQLNGKQIQVLIETSRKTPTDVFNATWKEVPYNDTLTSICGVATVLSHRYRRLVGGTPAQVQSWPWIVQVRTTIMSRDLFYRRSICGGVIISPWHILTAAHCVVRKNQVLKYEVLFGTVTEFQTDVKWVEIKSSNIIPHESYERNGKHVPQNDIALLKLSDKIHFNSNIQPICLKPKSNIHIDDTNCKFAGWGRQKYTSYHSKTLNTVSARSWGHCSKSKSILCVTYQKRKGGACKGDSGSPLICHGSDQRYYLRGLLSYGGKTCPSMVDAHTDISYHMAWIKSNMSYNENT